MEHTATYGLTQWSKSDRIQMEDFNSDNLKLEQALAGLATQAASAGNCKIVTGTYAGTGNYGSTYPRKLTFSGTPLAVFVGGGGYQFFAGRNMTAAMSYGQSQRDATLQLTWGDNMVQWYEDSDAQRMLNLSGTTYSYVALLATE